MSASHFQIFLDAIEKCSNREGILGEEDLVFPPTVDSLYAATPRNAVTFGQMGVDGVHFTILRVDGEIDNNSPVIQVGPMDFSEPYVVLGDSFLDYLAGACAVSLSQMEKVFKDEQSGKEALVQFVRERYQHSRLFDPKRLRNIREFVDLIEPSPDA
jgi:hypothetical protein